MNIKERACRIHSILDEFFPSPSPSLSFYNPYTFLVAVLLSAQCTDRRVNRVAPLLFAKASSPEDMILLSQDEIIEIVRPCGLGPKKGRAIYELSEMLIAEYGSNVPDSLESLMRLPGVGRKTASVVVSQWFGYPAFPVDTHIERCARRWNLSEKKSVRGVEEDLKALFPIDSWNSLHLQIIYYARAYCPAQRHRVEGCPICLMLSEESKG
ncbi:MAG: endonuclease III [Chlamydiota bacterium]|nr:endonuclease III [Chlamydiota bacterium]